jgi:hypothetical protein
MRVEKHLAQGFVAPLNCAGKLGASLDQSAHDEGVHG